MAWLVGYGAGIVIGLVVFAILESMPKDTPLSEFWEAMKDGME